MSTTERMAQLINRALSDGHLSSEEANGILRAYYYQRWENEVELMDILRQYGVDVRDVPKPNVPQTINRNILEKALIEMGDQIKGTTLRRNTMSRSKKEKITWLSIVGPSALVCLIHLL